MNTNPKHKLAGNAQYWYAETFRIRQLYTDAASAYLEGYQKYPKNEKAPINLLKLGVSMVQIGEKDQGCSMITGVKKQYPQANQSILQKDKWLETLKLVKEDFTKKDLDYLSENVEFINNISKNQLTLIINLL